MLYYNSLINESSSFFYLKFDGFKKNQFCTKHNCWSMFSELNPTVNYSPTFDVHSFRTRCLKLSLFLNTIVPGWIKDGTKLFASVEGQTLHAAKITLYPVYHLLKKKPIVSCAHYFCGTCQSRNIIKRLRMSTNMFKF